ncbi:MAG: CpaF family protein [Bacteriovoracaceae bacterium]|nr:CpaF family protein [Bacteriovoracaceae bacterium]
MGKRVELLNEDLSKAKAIFKKSNGVCKLLAEMASKKGVTEIVINGPDKIFVERKGKLIFLKAKIDRREILEFIESVAEYNNQNLGSKYPILDGLLPDGNRINIIMPPYVRGFPAITIRKYELKGISFDQNPDLFSLSKDWISFLKACVKSRLNIIVSGGTAVGKTTFLNLLLGEVSQDERVICIEDTLELEIDKPNVVRLETSANYLASESAKISVRDLVKNSLRMRPDRIIIGEVRGAEAFDFLMAMNTGHSGSMGSLHANSTGDCLQRIEVLYHLSGFDIPIKAIREQISNAVDIVIQLGRTPDGERVVEKISEVTGMEEERVLMQNIAHRQGGKLVSTGIASQNTARLVENGLRQSFFSDINKS